MINTLQPINKQSILMHTPYDQLLPMQFLVSQLTSLFSFAIPNIIKIRDKNRILKLNDTKKSIDILLFINKMLLILQ